jgi:hypothetical protein
MNRTEATGILCHHMDSLETSGYNNLARRIGEEQSIEIRGDTGVIYQLEISILWDRDPRGAICIIGSIDDGGLRAFLPLTDSRLVEPVTGEINQ